MKLSNHTLSVLRNFATINPNILVQENTNQLKTISEYKNIMATADIDETINATFGIYDLNEFLAAVNLLTDPDFDFDSTMIQMHDSQRESSLTYICAASEILTYPQKEIQNPEYEVTLTIQQEVITGLKKAASVFGFDTFQIVKGKDSSDVLFRVCDVQNKSSNTYSEKVGEVNSEAAFNFDFLISNLKCIQDDYDVHLSSQYISCWETKRNAITYWIAMETTSSYSSNL
jgi:hypothetical protein